MLFEMIGVDSLTPAQCYTSCLGEILFPCAEGL